MHVVRLTRLAEILEADAANPEGVKFDLSNWAKPVGGAGIYGRADAVPKPSDLTISCGTKACAFGLACLQPEFQEQGLRFEVLPNRHGYSLIPTFDGNRDFHAAEAFFEISNTEAERLFSPANYPVYKLTGAEGELAVAERIRELVGNALAVQP